MLCDLWELYDYLTNNHLKWNGTDADQIKCFLPFNHFLKKTIPMNYKLFFLENYNFSYKIWIIITGNTHPNDKPKKKKQLCNFYD